MFLPVFGFGLFLGAMYALFRSIIWHRELFVAFGTVAFWLSAYLFERSWATMLGVSVGFMVYLGVPTVLLDRFLLVRFARDQAAGAGGELMFDTAQGPRAVASAEPDVRVLHVSPYFAPAHQYGGPPASILGLCKGLQRAGVDVEVVTTTANGRTPLPASSAEGSEYDGVPVRYVPAAFPRRFFGAQHPRGRSPTRSSAPTSATSTACGTCRSGGRRTSRAPARVPYVVSPRGMLQPQAMRRGRCAQGGRVFAARAPQSVAGAALLHATSEQEADAIRDLQLGVPVAVVPNGVDLCAAQQAANGYRARARHPARRLRRACSSGACIASSGSISLAGAFAELRATHPSAHLVLAGPDEHGLVPDLHAAAVRARRRRAHRWTRSAATRNGRC